MTATWQCPGCHLHLEAVAIAVGHKCPSRRNRWTDFIPKAQEVTRAT
jgi:hypothetical protein